MPAQISLFEPEQTARPARTIYEEMTEFLDHWYDPCPACGRTTRGMWSGYALAIWRIYLCMECFNKYYENGEIPLKGIQPPDDKVVKRTER